jgi:2',3'-cyclic-nucleotide 2'-phosphodiesterase (5'-nucleotidase family)
VKLGKMSTYALQRLAVAVAGSKWGKVLGQFDDVGRLRNRTVHGHRQITEELLLEAYIRSPKERKKLEPDQATDLILQGMKQAWEDVVGRPFVTENPFDQINRLLLASFETLP